VLHDFHRKTPVPGRFSPIASLNERNGRSLNPRSYNQAALFFLSLKKS
jgi:hypothetical protein